MEASPWSPLRKPIFRAMWIASLASNLGTWMHLVAAAWQMTLLTDSVALVALVQTAAALPVFALALPGGALADVADRRWMIVLTQGWQLAVAAALGIVTVADALTPTLLLGLTTALSAGAAIGLPVFLATIPELVSTDELPAAVSLNTVSITLAQAVGPTLGGVLVATAGAGAVFLLNAASFLAVAAVAVAWRRAPSASSLPPEHVVAAIRTGTRYFLNSRPLQVVLFRVATHVLFFSVLPALLVVVTRTRLGLGAGGYGVLFGCFGLGGAAGSLILPRVRDRVDPDRLALIGAAALGLPLVALATFRTAAPLFPLMVLAGAGSATVIASLSVAAQTVLPDWVRGRGLAMYILTFQAALAGGAALWGAVGGRLGLPTALAAAAAGVVLLHLASGRLGPKLVVTTGVDLTPAPWVEPQLLIRPELEEGPVLVEIEYRIAAGDLDEFLAAMPDLRRNRRRDGAVRWHLFQDMSDPERYVESFLVSSWAEHERAHERAVRSDRAAVERVLALHRGDPPRVSHLRGRSLR